MSVFVSPSAGYTEFPNHPPMRVIPNFQTRALGLGWTSAGLPHTSYIYREYTESIACVRTPYAQVAHSKIYFTLACSYFYAYVLNSANRCLFLSPPMRVIPSFCAQNKAEGLSPVDPDISRGVTDLYLSRGYTHPITREIEVSHTQLAKLSFYPKPFWSISPMKRDKV